jgi:hypothetical protein
MPRIEANHLEADPPTGWLPPAPRSDVIIRVKFDGYRITAVQYLGGSDLSAHPLFRQERPSLKQSCERVSSRQSAP